jgi:type I restriction enzyme, S subunit
MVDTWTTSQIGSHLINAGLRDPRKTPETDFIYVDVSSVDNALFKITNPSLLIGAEAPSRARKIIRTGDVIYATVRPTLKRIAFITPEFDNQICSTGFCVLRTNGTLDSRFLYFWLITDPITKHVEGIQRGASYPAIRDTDVKKMMISIPSLPEQRRIAGVLTAVQRAVEQQERLIVLTAELKKSLMHKLFTEGTRGEPQKQTEIGPIPESWEVVLLDSLLTEPLRNGHSARATNNNTGIRTLTLTAVTKNDFSKSNTKLTCANLSLVKDMWLIPNDIFIERANTLDYIGLAALYEGAANYAIFPDLLVRVRVDPMRMRPKVLADYLISSPCRKYFRLNAKGTAGNFPKVDQGIIGAISVPVPTKTEQEEMECALRTADTKHQQHVNAHGLMKSLFRTILHQLMTAQIRVDQVDLSELKSLGIEVD